MGTRSLTIVYDGSNKPIINMYRQCDGYVSGHGLQLAEFLIPFEIVNGIQGNPKLGVVANGMACLSAQLVKHFKDGVGGIYLYCVDDRDCWQDYEYHVYKKEIKVKRLNPTKLVGYDWIFQGSHKEFHTFATTREA